MSATDDARAGSTRARPTRGSGRTSGSTPATSTVVAGVVVLVLLALPGLLSIDRVGSWLQDRGLVDAPAGFTELAFPNPAAIPGFVLKDGTTTFTFTVRNHSEDAKTVRWRVVQSLDAQGATSKTLVRGEVALDPGQTWSKDIDTRVSCRERSRVQVQVMPDGERTRSINLLVRSIRTGAGPQCYAGAGK